MSIKRWVKYHVMTPSCHLVWSLKYRIELSGHCLYFHYSYLCHELLTALFFGSFNWDRPRDAYFIRCWKTGISVPKRSFAVSIQSFAYERECYSWSDDWCIFVCFSFVYQKRFFSLKSDVCNNCLIWSFESMKIVHLA